MPYASCIRAGAVLALLVLTVACNQQERVASLEIQNQHLADTLRLERTLRHHLQAYIDTTLGGGSPAFREKMKAYEEAYQVMLKPDTVIAVRHDTIWMDTCAPPAGLERLEQELSTLSGSLLGHSIHLRRQGDELRLRVDEKALFETEKARLSEAGKTLVRKLSRQFSRFPGLQVRVEGHIDTLATPQASRIDSWQISLTRALAVSDALAEAGLPPAQICVAGRGGFLPLNPNDDLAGRYFNRRTDLILRLPERQ